MSEDKHNSIIRKIANNIRRKIIAGLLFLLPIAITYLVLKFLFNVIDGILQPGFEAIFGEKMPGLGVIAIIILVYLFGLLGSNILGRWIAKGVENAFLKLPIVRAIYSPAKQLIDSFSGKRKTGFRRVVIVEYPKVGVWTIGFLTGMTTDEDGRDMAVVYMPTAPTPQSGWMAIFPIEDVYDIDMTVQDAIQLVISGGITAPPQIKKKGSIQSEGLGVKNNQVL